VSHCVSTQYSILSLLQADWQEVQTEVTEPLSRAVSALAPAQRGLSDASALISHFDDWANVLDSHELESSLSRRGSGKLEGVEPDALRNTVDGLLKRQPAPSKLQPHAPSPAVWSELYQILHVANADLCMCVCLNS